MSDARASSTGSAPEHASVVRTWALMGLLLLVNILNFVDRQIPTILAESIKRDLSLTDTQLGLINGLGFAVIYGTAGIPLARLADRVGHRIILAGGLLVWSALTALGGAARSFGELMATRLGVAAGEAVGAPVSHAIIAQQMPARLKGRAIAVFSLGVPLGTMIGLIFGGWMNDALGWRNALLLAGMPGVVLALVVWLVVPRRAPTGATAMSSVDTDALGTIAAIKVLWSQRAFRQICYALGIYSFGANATIAFFPMFLMRTYGIAAKGAGLSLGLLYGLVGVAGVLIGGMLADRLGNRDRRWLLWAPGIALALAAPFTILSLFAANSNLSVLLLAIPKFANLLYFGPVFVAVQAISPSRLWATASAVVLFFNSLVGLAIGPVVVGAISDSLSATLGQQSLRYALCIVAISQVWAAAHFVLGARSLAAGQSDSGPGLAS